MMNPIIFSEVARTYQQDLLKEVEHWQAISLATVKKPGKMCVIRRIVTDVIQSRIRLPKIRDLIIPQFSDENVR